MTAVITTVSIAPLHATSSIRSEQVSQLVLGEAALVVNETDEMLEVRTVLDEYSGWIHRGYVRQTDVNTVEGWLADSGWSIGAGLEVAGTSLRAPHRARLTLEGNDRVRLPDGRPARILQGTVLPYHELIVESAKMLPAEWAWRQFANAPYLWGGVSEAGIDCTALVQTTFLARGVPLPRDAHDQVAVGTSIDSGKEEPGDLLFFRGESVETITHVAIADDENRIVHATIDTGRVTRESTAAGSRVFPLMDRLVAIRRLA